MRTRWWVPLAFIAPCALLAWLSVSGVWATWVVYAGWALVVGGLVVRAARPPARGHRVRAAAEPTFAAVDQMQNIYLGRPDLGPVAYGPEGPPSTGLVVDRADPDPADLSRSAPG